LNKAYASLGLNLYIDILFNDLNTDEYFERYSELNLKRLLKDIEKLKNSLYSLINKPQQLHSDSSSNSLTNSRYKLNQSLITSKLMMNKSSLVSATQSAQRPEIDRNEELRLLKMNIKLLFELYAQEDLLSFELVKLYAEYYNNLLKPLIDSRDLAKQNMLKFERKVQNQEKALKFLHLKNQKTSLDILNELKSSLDKSRQEISDLTRDIDTINVEYKQFLIDLNSKLLGKMLNRDKLKFLQTNNSALYPLLFEFMTRVRQERIEKEIRDRKIQMLNSQIFLLEREKDLLSNSKNNQQEKLKEVQIKIIKLRLLLCNQEENEWKFKLEKFKQEKLNLNTSGLRYHDLRELADELGHDFVQEINEKFKFNFSVLINEKKTKQQENDEKDFFEIQSDDSDLDNEAYLDEDKKFFDAYEEPESILEEQMREKKKLMDEMNQLKKKILDFSSKKSSLRLNLNRIHENDKLEKLKEEQELNDGEEDQKTAVKSLAVSFFMFMYNLKTGNLFKMIHVHVFGHSVTAFRDEFLFFVRL
jgi:hypothetical protein